MKYINLATLWLTLDPRKVGGRTRPIFSSVNSGSRYRGFEFFSVLPLAETKKENGKRNEHKQNLSGNNNAVKLSIELTSSVTMFSNGPKTPGTCVFHRPRYLDPTPSFPLIFP